MVKFLLGRLALVPWFLFVVNGSYLQGQIALFGGHQVALVGTLKAALLLVLLSCAFLTTRALGLLLCLALMWELWYRIGPCAHTAFYTQGYAPKSIVCRNESARIDAKSRSHDKSLLADCYGLRSCFLCTRLFFAYVSPKVYLRLPVMILNRIRRRRWNRTGMVLRRAFGMHGPGSESQLIASAQERRAKRC